MSLPASQPFRQNVAHRRELYPRHGFCVMYDDLIDKAPAQR
jgi:hypothetical protein